jgi:hypothetical protein
MTAVWIMLFVCMSSSSSCSQGDVSVANTSYASSEECYADGMKRARGRVVVCIEGKDNEASELPSLRSRLAPRPGKVLNDFNARKGWPSGFCGQDSTRFFTLRGFLKERGSPFPPAPVASMLSRRHPPSTRAPS